MSTSKMPGPPSTPIKRRLPQNFDDSQPSAEKRSRPRAEFEWLQKTCVDGVEVFGCSKCAAAYKSRVLPERICSHSGFRAWALHVAKGGWQLCNLKRHEQSLGHVSAVSVLRNKSKRRKSFPFLFLCFLFAQDRTRFIMRFYLSYYLMSLFSFLSKRRKLFGSSPSKAQFQKVLSEIDKRSIRAHSAGIGFGRKVKKLIWCLAEARRNDMKAQLFVCPTIGLHQDKGCKRLHVRFTASTHDLQQVSGVFGIERMTGGHKQIIDTTVSILRSFCTKCHGRLRSERERNCKIEVKRIFKMIN